MDENPTRLNQNVEDVFEEKPMLLNATYEPEDYYYEAPNMYVEIADVILKCVLYLCAMAVNVFLICVLCKFKALKTRLNGYILSYTVLNTACLGCMPLFFIFDLIMNFQPVHFVKLWCVANGIQSTTLVLSFLTVLMLVSDYLLIKFAPDYIKKYKVAYKYAKEIVYCAGLVQFLIVAGLCFSPHSGSYRLSTYYAEMSKWVYAFVLIGVSALDVVHKCKSGTGGGGGVDKNRSALIVANIIVFFWFPQFVYDTVTRLLEWDMYLYTLLVYTAFVPQYMAMGHQIVVIVALGVTDKNFKVAFYRIFKSDRRNYAGDFEEETSGCFEEPTTGGDIIDQNLI